MTLRASLIRFWFSIGCATQTRKIFHFLFDKCEWAEDASLRNNERNGEAMDITWSDIISFVRWLCKGNMYVRPSRYSPVILDILIVTSPRLCTRATKIHGKIAVLTPWQVKYFTFKSIVFACARAPIRLRSLVCERATAQLKSDEKTIFDTDTKW